MFQALMPDFIFEKASGARCVAGVDEVGRGPLAGPVMAAAVILDPARVPDGLDDSKRLSAKRRDALALQIWEVAEVSIGEASVEEIDIHNILCATYMAMERAVAGLPRSPDHILIDGNKVPPGLQDRGQAIVKGDIKSLSIAAASIVAKTCRDKLMAELALQFPGYGWERNAGYGTKVHRQALQDIGITPHHRRSFAPIRNML